MKDSNARRNKPGSDLNAGDPPERLFDTPEDLAGWDPKQDLGRPGEYPYTRGIYPGQYRSRLWTMRQYAGFGSARESKRALPVPAFKGDDGAFCGV